MLEGRRVARWQQSPAERQAPAQHFGPMAAEAVPASAVAVRGAVAGVLNAKYLDNKAAFTDAELGELRAFLRARFASQSRRARARHRLLHGGIQLQAVSSVPVVLLPLAQVSTGAWLRPFSRWGM